MKQRRKRRRTVELIGDNNGRTVCNAYRLDDGRWLCYERDYHEDNKTVATMREAIEDLKDRGAARVIRCPEIVNPQPIEEQDNVPKTPTLLLLQRKQRRRIRRNQ